MKEFFAVIGSWLKSKPEPVKVFVVNYTTFVVFADNRKIYGTHDQGKNWREIPFNPK